MKPLIDSTFVSRVVDYLNLSPVFTSALMPSFIYFQWKVRRTLAFSIHEMALILGDEITSLDLVPIFNGFLKDLDEVRIGVLKHFADFVKVREDDLEKLPKRQSRPP